MKKPEFSKVIFVCVALLTVSVTVFACLLMWRTEDTTALPTLILAVFGEFATGTGLYYWKARAENKIKLKAAWGMKPETADFE